MECDDGYDQADVDVGWEDSGKRWGRVLVLLHVVSLLTYPAVNTREASTCACQCTNDRVIFCSYCPLFLLAALPSCAPTNVSPLFVSNIYCCTVHAYITERRKSENKNKKMEKRIEHSKS
mmetsp:Transcript_12801/g.33870  ORF Transcript_12801/g.33870 Transcript_12801/m.33870 type:complete len:120 (-) Transcript_12801:1808-2167(-)